MSQPGDPFEREAAREAEALVRQARVPPAGAGEATPLERVRAAASARFGGAVTQARLHTGSDAARVAAGYGARALTYGHDIAFGEGQFRPDSEAGQRLLAHELVHVAQQPRLAEPTVQRDVVNMEPLVVRSTLAPVDTAVSDLDRLTGAGVTAGGMTVAHDDATVRRNAPAATRALPFRAGSWDAQAILTALGQYDTMPGTDSDAVRCVQAVAMASRIVEGPDGVIGFLNAMLLQGMLMSAPTPRQATAMEVLEHIVGRIQTQRATFGDLLWAQEALHDLFYDDVSGTPQGEIGARVAPPLELFGPTMVPMNTWCNSPQDVMTAANQLQPGEQLLVNTWRVVFNNTFDDLEEQHGIVVPEGGSTTVEVNGRLRRLRRIDASRRPDHSAIDLVRDRQSGHQLLVVKDAASSQLRLYEPEVTTTGQHFEDLAADGSNFVRYFRDMPEIGIYEYIQILGRLTPSSRTSFGSAASALP